MISIIPSQAIGGAPVTQTMTDGAAEGTSGSGARSDHKHGMPGYGVTPVTQAFGDAASEGNSAAPARGNHKHGMPAGSTPVYGRVVYTAGNITTTSTTLVLLTGSGITLTTAANPVWMMLTANTYTDTAGAVNYVNVAVGGVQELGTNGMGQDFTGSANVTRTATVAHQSAALTAASHLFEVYWKVSNGTGTIWGGTGTPYSFSVGQGV